MNQPEAASLRSRHGDPLLLERVNIDGDLRGAMLEVSMEQRFRNPMDAHLEVVYTFPLPWGAVLLDVDVMLGDQHLVGAVVEKDQAEDRYEQALSQGDAAILLERNQDQSYSLNLGNLAGRETCVVTLRYAQLLPFDGGSLRVLIPTVLAPRYGDPLVDGGLQPHQAPEHDLCASYPLDIKLRLHGELARSRVASPSHPAALSIDGDLMTVELARLGTLDRDFVLVIDRIRSAVVGLQAFDAHAPGHVVALASFCPRITGAAPARLCVKMLVDCSGSMAGDSIDAARRALQAIVLRLDAQDRFSLSRFGSTVAHRSRGLWSLSDATRLAAQRWIGDLQADLGGTEMESALASTFALASDAGADVLIVTDGEIHAIDRTIEAARASSHRLFVVGVGSAPAESHLRRLAEATGGACDFVAPGEAVEPAVLRMFARLRSPRLDDVHIAWPQGTEPLWTSAIPATVFDSAAASVYAVFPLALAGTVRLMGRRDGASIEQIGEITFSGTPVASDVLPRMAASARIAGSDRVETTAPPDSLQLALQYQLVTAHTDLLLVHERADESKATDMPALRKIASMVPAGWAGAGALQLCVAQDVASFSIGQHYATPQAVPSVWRTNRAKIDAASIHDVDFEVPAFLRRNASPAAPDPRRHSDLHGIRGLTPWGLVLRLRALPPSAPPRRYAELTALGLDPWIIEWLEFAVAPGLDEATVVRSFVRIMTQARLAATSSDVLELSAATALDPATRQMLEALRGVEADRWPDSVFSLEVPAAWATSPTTVSNG